MKVFMVSVDDYNIVKECDYKDEHYSVRDNGAVMRHQREGKRIRKDDNTWTFGKPNEKSGYMEIAGQRVHRIVAVAFHGNPPTDQYVVDHIDTNRRNNRPENLRWLTRLENVLNNEITRARIENICGSVEAFLQNPSILKGHEDNDPNFKWMRTVSPEEARATLERLTLWAKNRPKSQGGKIGEWIFDTKPIQRHDNEEGLTFGEADELLTRDSHENLEMRQSLERNYDEWEEEKTIYESLSPKAKQLNWKTPTEFPCCPIEIGNNPLEQYCANLTKDAIFSKNQYNSSIVVDAAISIDGQSLVVMTEFSDWAVKPFALSIITYEDGSFIHSSGGTFFHEDGALKNFTLAQGKEWTGGEAFDDFC